MTNMPKNDILVTGAHRSGTTWVGQVIGQAPGVHYIHEPFNVGIEREYTPLNHWFEFLSVKSEAGFQKEVRKYVRSFYLDPQQSSNSRRTKFIGLKKLLSNDDARNHMRRNLIKDPLAVMSAEWFYKSLKCDVVVLIRHPAAFVASLKIKNWGFAFNNLLDQNDLMDSYLKDFQEQIRDFTREKHDIIHQGILLWNIIYSVVKKYQDKYEGKWYFIRHEDLSTNPIAEYSKMFSYLNLDFTEQVRKKIINSSTAKNDTNFKRNSKENIVAWKQRLDENEIALIKEQTFPLWSDFYSGNEW